MPVTRQQNKKTATREVQQLPPSVGSVHQGGVSPSPNPTLAQKQGAQITTVSKDGSRRADVVLSQNSETVPSDIEEVPETQFLNGVPVTEIPSTIPSLMEAIPLLDDIENNNTIEPQPKSKPSLLELRKQFKKIYSSTNRAKSHHVFIKSCIEEKRIPIGLQIKTTCNAFRSKETDIETSFGRIIAEAENNLLLALEEHYGQILQDLEEELGTLNLDIDAVITRSTEDELTSHNELMKKTVENLQQSQKKRNDNKNKKLHRIKETGRNTTVHTRNNNRNDYRENRGVLNCGGYGPHYVKTFQPPVPHQTLPPQPLFSYPNNQMNYNNNNNFYQHHTPTQYHWHEPFETNYYVPRQQQYAYNRPPTYAQITGNFFQGQERPMYRRH